MKTTEINYGGIKLEVQYNEALEIESIKVIDFEDVKDIVNHRIISELEDMLKDL